MGAHVAEGSPPGTAAPVHPAAAAAQQDADGDAAALYASGSRLRIAGIVVTSVGIVLQAVGIGLVGAGAAIHASSGDETTDYAIAGIWGIALGTLCLPVGIPMWAVGSSRAARARRMGHEAARLQPFVTPVRGGAVAGLRLAEF